MFFSKKKRRAKKAEKEAQKAAQAAAALREHAEALGKHGSNAAIHQAGAVLAGAQRFAGDAAKTVQKKAGPVAKDISKKTAKFASDSLDNLEPHIKGALDKVTPAVDSARAKVADDYLPKLQELLHNAADAPVVGDVAKLGEEGVENLRKHVKPERKRGFWGWLGRILMWGTLIAGAVAAVRHFLAPKDDGWTAHEPSKAYVNNNDTFATAASFEKKDKADEGDDAKDTEAGDFLADPGTAESEELEVSTHVDDAAPLEEVEAQEELTVEDRDPAASDYGEGSYVGDNPPEGFVIKGNERSKKYHVEGSGGYERTIAEVWFNSEEAAKAAGFTRAQR